MSHEQLTKLSHLTRAAILLTVIVSTELGLNIGLYLATLAWLELPLLVKAEGKLISKVRAHKRHDREFNH